MNWTETRASHPNEWLLVEALRARSEGGHRILEDLAVLAAYGDSTAAMRAYLARHRETPARELYVVHTSRETLDITERAWLGVRGLECSGAGASAGA